MAAPAGQAAGPAERINEEEPLLYPSPGSADAGRHQPGADDAQKHKYERLGFYLYSWAVEVYAVVALTLFLPITLEQYAREAGRLASDHTAACSDPIAICQVHTLGLWLNTASFSLYTYSASVALQALTVIAISRAANSPRARKKLLSLFTLVGSVSCALFLLVPSGSAIWTLAALFTITGNVAFGAAIVCLNAYLPTLAKDYLGGTHGIVSQRNVQPVAEDHGTSESVGADSEDSHALSQATSAISSIGIAAGYAAGMLLLLLMLIPVSLMKGSTLSLRLAVAISGVWWFAFSIPALAYLPSSKSSLASPTNSFLQPWRELMSILGAYRQIPQTFLYLLAWFVMSDAFATITSTAVLFAKTTLGIPAQQLVWVGVLTPLCGILGALAWPKLQASVLKSSNLATLRIIVAFAVLIPLWGIVALRTPLELLLLACYFGALYGALQSYSRAVFSHLIPPREEARFFALYSITDKSSSFIGPAVVALIADKTGSVRAGFVFLLVALLLPLPVLQRVDMEKGKRDAERFAGAIEQPLEGEP